MPPFKFANGISPWCLCQGYTANMQFEIEIVKLDSVFAEIFLIWNNEISWRNFKISLAIDNNFWKIIYLEGFDYTEGIRKDGEL